MDTIAVNLDQDEIGALARWHEMQAKWNNSRRQIEQAGRHEQRADDLFRLITQRKRFEASK